MKIHGLQKMTLLDFPGKVACTVFLGGCDLRCPFYIDRLQGGCYIEDYPYDRTLIEEYKALLGDDVKALAATDERLVDMARILDELEPMATDYIPADSLIREFIGGSSFEY